MACVGVGGVHTEDGVTQKTLLFRGAHRPDMGCDAGVTPLLLPAVLRSDADRDRNARLREQL